jgi:peptidoglycan/xylan/chitin deacetylase (PgdA/CDA1 family)
MLLDALMRRAVTATFFVQGRWASSYPALVRRMAEAGHDVASHSHHHAPMTLLTDEGVRRDVAWAEHRIKKRQDGQSTAIFATRLGQVIRASETLLSAWGTNCLAGPWTLVIGTAAESPMRRP